jgi:hypothetical protein
VRRAPMRGALSGRGTRSSGHAGALASAATPTTVIPRIPGAIALPWLGATTHEGDGMRDVVVKRRV